MRLSVKIEKITFTKALTTLLVLDLLMVLLHIVFSENLDLFHLDREQNIPTIYQSTKLLLAAIILGIHMFVFKFGKVTKGLSLVFWGILFLMIFSLGLDEVGQIHESIDHHLSQILPDQTEEYKEIYEDIGYKSAPWLLYYIPVFLFAGGIFFYLIREYLRTKNSTTLFIIIGLSFFLLVPLVEYINTNSSLTNPTSYENLIIVEELFEMVGASILLTTLVLAARNDYEKLSVLSSDGS
ncbi:MAG TPA: hypothetical protein VGA67_05430 [Candidatus Dojkabacteria bacterium]|jgi:hypothetical protein